MTKKPHKRNEDNRFNDLKSHKPHIVSSDRQTDRWTDRQTYRQVIPKYHLCLQQILLACQNLNVILKLHYSVDHFYKCKNIFTDTLQL